MKVHMMFALCALMIPYLPLQCRCNCCLDTVIKSIFQTFNPNVEAGPERIISRHPYDDGFMPEYPAAVIGHDGKWVKPPDDDFDDYDDDDDNGSVPSADYVDDGASSGSGTSNGKGGGGKSGDSGGRRLGYSIQQHKSDAAVAAASAGSGPVTRPDDYRPFSDFIVSVLQTVQLTPQAILKKSKGKSNEARAAKTTTVQPESDGGIPGTW